MDSEDPYELERQRIIKENQALLESLGLGVSTHEPQVKVVVSKRPVAEPRKASRSSARISTIVKGAIRTSTRIITGSERGERARPLRDFIREESEDHLLLRNGEGLGRGVALARLHNPKRFGSIPNVPLFKSWPLRAGASMDSIHAPLVACISGNPVDGAWSVCFSGGYEDNKDRGESFVLTGAGGRDLKGNGKNLRTAGQSFDQSFDHAMNGALKRSSETGKVVRVVRGYKTDSDYAPVEGYRYDGLYTVTSAKLVRSPATKFKVCVFEFKRVKGQKKIPKRSEIKVIGDGGESEVEDEEVVAMNRRGSRESGEVDEVEAQVGEDEIKAKEEVSRGEPSTRRSARVKEAPVVNYSRPRRAYNSRVAKVEQATSRVAERETAVKTPEAASRRSTRVVEVAQTATRPGKRSLELEPPSRRSKRVRA